MAIIHTRKGEAIIVDDADFDELSKFTWRLNNSGYAMRDLPRPRPRPKPETKCAELMHRRILGLTPDDHRHGDHINFNRTDNRRENLRIATFSNSQAHRRTRKDNKSGHKGVYWRNDIGKFEAQIRINGKLKRLGYFDDENTASKSFSKAAKEQYGEFALS